MRFQTVDMLSRLKQTPVDLVMLQMETPAMDGVQTLEKLRESCPETGVIAISASNSENPEDAANAVRMGPSILYPLSASISVRAPPCHCAGVSYAYRALQGPQEVPPGKTTPPGALADAEARNRPESAIPDPCNRNQSENRVARTRESRPAAQTPSPG